MQYSFPLEEFILLGESFLLKSIFLFAENQFYPKYHLL